LSHLTAHSPQGRSGGASDERVLANAETAQFIAMTSWSRDGRYIRFANQGVWDAAGGMNRLAHNRK
jgi:hypothetical protein